MICSADSDTQVKAIADEIDKSLRDSGLKSWHKEGYRALNWVLIDYVDVVVHVFKKDMREFYNLEKLWGDAPVIEVEDPALKKAEPVKEKKTVRKTSAKSVFDLIVHVARYRLLALCGASIAAIAMKLDVIAIISPMMIINATFVFIGLIRPVS